MTYALVCVAFVLAATVASLGVLALALACGAVSLLHVGGRIERERDEARTELAGLCAKWQETAKSHGELIEAYTALHDYLEHLERHSKRGRVFVLTSGEIH